MHMHGVAFPLLMQHTPSHSSAVATVERPQKSKRVADEEATVQAAAAADATSKLTGGIVGMISNIVTSWGGMTAAASNGELASPTAHDTHDRASGKAAMQCTIPAVSPCDRQSASTLAHRGERRSERQGHMEDTQARC